MRFALSMNDDFLAAFGLDRAILEALAEEEEDFLAQSREYESTRVVPADWARAAVQEMTSRELAEFGAAAFPPSSFFETTGSLRPRRRQQAPAPPPQPPHPGAWDRGRACVVNATNTYWSYGREPGCSQQPNVDLADGQRVYMKQPDGTYRWAAFEQQARSTLAANKQLHQMVRDVGGDPYSFRSRLAMAEHVLAREAPRGVVREEDEREIFSGSFPVDLGEPASACFWGVGQLGDGTLTMAASTQGEMERWN